MSGIKEFFYGVDGFGINIFLGNISNINIVNIMLNECIFHVEMNVLTTWRWSVLFLIYCFIGMIKNVHWNRICIISSENKIVVLTLFYILWKPQSIHILHTSNPATLLKFTHWEVFFIFRFFKSVLFFVNWISLYFFHILLNTTIFCL